ncbi:BatD family protein [Shimia abyssi]|uniref:Oxygen tolerance protein BatD n=1 Tax=Shimia abyssi TaxID=1662395 RepID=A0A2P8FJY7_9RHOB|nr:BatD family protein [Shimia abyssi]PSL21999.1 oxygen tolerance protein BatD [Shimia abyssi]
MIRLALTLFLAITSLATAQTVDPRVEIEFSETEAIPGQPLSLRITVLVPTWMPDPPEWPSFEAPNILVTAPERASSPTSKTIDGETWSGVSRRYRITPMVPGTVILPAQTMRVTYAAPPATDPISAEVPIDALTLTGTLPPGAEGLDPFIAASALTLTHEVEGETTGLKAGDSFSVTVTAKLSDLPPMFLPQLVTGEVPEGLRAYPESPILNQSEDRGKVSGARSEKVVYVAEGGVEGALPAMSLEWYNLETQKIETATLAEISVQADAPPASAQTAQDINWPRVIAMAAMALVILTLGIVAGKKLTPPVRAALARRRARQLASAKHAWTQLERALKDRDLPATHAALALWQSRALPLTSTQQSQIDAAFVAIGHARYGPNATRDNVSGWQTLSSLLHSTKQAQHAQRFTRSALPALNPQATPRHL